MPGRKKHPKPNVFPTPWPGALYPNVMYAAATAALLRDFRVNAFAFAGFPAVSMSQGPDAVELSLHVVPHTAGPLVLPAERAIAVARQFQKEGTCDIDFIKAVQNLVLRLEVLVNNPPLAQSLAPMQAHATAHAATAPHQTTPDPAHAASGS